MLYVYRFLWLRFFRLGWLLGLVYIRRFIYKVLNVCPFHYRTVAGSGGLARKQVNHSSCVAVVTPNDRSKSVGNRCEIELFNGVVCVVTLTF